MMTRFDQLCDSYPARCDQYDTSEEETDRRVRLNTELRVMRDANMENGMWLRFGDACLPGPPLHGVVVLRAIVPSRYGGLDHLIRVRFDTGSFGNFFTHGLRLESGSWV